MEIIQGLIQPPKIQSADETIPTLCDRVESATLIGDRRSAVLGLKSFSRDYRETVIASGLKPLLSTLKRDYEDDSLSVKAILETLLILFIRGDGNDDLTRNWISQQSRLQNGKYPSPLVMKQEREQVDQFSLWIADAITQSDEIVHLVIELLNTENFHIRLYTTQLLEAIVATRPERSRNAITSLPTGISTLVSLLQDAHEPVRDEAVLLLMAVVNDSPHVQKLVAFENIFEQLFSIIDEEGGLRGSLVVNDCLSLINNILKYNTSNQSLFLETGNLPKLAQILNEPLANEEFFWNEQRVININTAMDIVNLTVEPGNSATGQHQKVLTDSSVLMIVLRLAFYEKIPNSVRPTALLTAASLIRGNEYCQNEFGKIDVPFFDPSSPLASNSETAQVVPVVTLLIHWVLYANSIQVFPTRMASMELIKAYLDKCEDIQLKFVAQQIEKYHERNKSRDDDPLAGSNIFESLLEYDPDLKLNPYKLFFTADIFMFLFQAENIANDKVREISRSVKSGVEIDEEYSLTSIQMVSELLTTALAAEDIRIPIAYVTLLIFWLFGDTNAVNDFLSERSVIQSLLSFSYQLQDDDITIKCLVTMLLGVTYEFSTGESPFPRKEYFEYLTKTLGRDNYLSRINQFKADSLFTKVKALSNLSVLEFDETGLPQVYFSPIFVQFFTENNYRIKTALLHSPDEEPCTKISFEAFERLQSECSTLKSKLNVLEETSETQLQELTSKLDSLTNEYEKYSEENKSLGLKISDLLESNKKLHKDVNQASQTIEELNVEREKLLTSRDEYKNDTETNSLKLNKSMERISVLEKELKDIRAEKKKAEDGINKMSRELFSLTKENQNLKESQKRNEKERKKEADELSEKRRSFETITKQMEALQSEKQITLKELNEWKSKFQSCETLLPKLTEKLRSLAENFKETEDERDKLAKTLESIKLERDKNVAELKEAVEKLSNEKAELASENEKKSLQIKQLNQAVEEIERKFEAENHATSQNRTEMENNLSKLRTEVESMETRTHELTKKNDELQEEIKKYQTAQTESTSTLSKIETALQESESKLADVLEQNKSLRQSLESQTKSFGENLEKLSNAEQAHAMDADRINSLQTEIDERKEKYKRESTKLEDNIKELQRQITNNTTTIAGLNKAIDQERQTNARLASELEETRKDKEISNSQAKEDALQLSKTIDELREERKDLEDGLAETKLNNTNLVSELDALKVTVGEKNGNIQELEKKKETASSALSKIKADFDETEKRLKAQIQSLQTKHERKVQDFDKERQLFAEGSDMVTQEYSKKINTLEEQISVSEKQIEEVKSQLQASEKTIRNLKSDSKASQQTNDIKMESLKSALASSEKQAKEVTQKYDKLKTSSDENASSLKGQIERLTEAVKSETRAKEINAKDLNQLKEKLQCFVETMNKLETLEKENAVLDQRVKKLKNEKEETVKNLEVKLETLSSEKQSLKEKLQGQSISLNDNESLREENNSLRRK